HSAAACARRPAGSSQPPVASGQLLTDSQRQGAAALPKPAPPAASLRATDPPDCVRSIVAHEERAVGRPGDSDRTTPDTVLVNHEASEKVLIHSGGFAVLERHANDLVSGAERIVPGAVLRDEDAAAMLGR